MTRWTILTLALMLTVGCAAEERVQDLAVHEVSSAKGRSELLIAFEPAARASAVFLDGRLVHARLSARELLVTGLPAGRHQVSVDYPTDTGEYLHADAEVTTHAGEEASVVVSLPGQRSSWASEDLFDTLLSELIGVTVAVGLMFLLFTVGVL